jgi:hypothetical protein
VNPNEQIGNDRKIIARKSAARLSKWLKRATAKLRRRLARTDPENAPVKGYRGWMA